MFVVCARVLCAQELGAEPVHVLVGLTDTDTLEVCPVLLFLCP